MASDAPRQVLLIRPTADLLSRANGLGVVAGVITSNNRPVDPTGLPWLVVSDRPDDLIRAANALCGKDPVLAIGLNEPAVPLAALFNEDRPSAWYTPEVCDRFADKLMMRTVLEDHPLLGGVPFRLVSCLDDLRQVVSAWPDGLILKPRRGSAGSGVRMIRSPEEAEAAWDRRERHLSWDPWPGSELEVSDWLAEAFLPGTEITTESFTHDGQHRLVAIVRKTTFPSPAGTFVSSAHSVSCDPADPLWAIASRYTSELLTVLGLTGGPAHSQWKYRKGQLRIIESHPRVSGDLIPEAISFLTGLDLNALTLRLAAGLTVPLDAPQAQRGAVAIVYQQAPGTGTVQRISGESAALSCAGVLAAQSLVQVGDTVAPAREAMDRVCVVMAFGPTAAEAMARATSAAGHIRLDIKASR